MIKWLAALILLVVFLLSLLFLFSNQSKIDYTTRTSGATREDADPLQLTNIGPVMVESAALFGDVEPVLIEPRTLHAESMVDVKGNILFDSTEEEAEKFSFLKVVITKQSKRHFDEHISTDTIQLKPATSQEALFSRAFYQQVAVPRKPGKYTLHLIEWIHGNFDFKKCKLIATADLKVDS
jgi:hypothetical protein